MVSPSKQLVVGLVLVALMPFLTGATIIVRGPIVAAGGGLASFSDDFNRADSDSLGANWTEVVTDVDIASNKLVVPTAFDNQQHFAVYSATACTTANQYIKATITHGTSGSATFYFRYTNSSTAYYEIRLDTVNNLVRWNHWTQVGGSTTEIGSTSFTVTTGDSVGITIEGTGTNTVLRVWSNPAGSAPSSASSWGGAATATLTDNPASPVDSGGYIGLGAVSIGADFTFDDFSGGDAP